MHVQVTFPEAEAHDVPLDSSLRIQFDRFLSRLSILRQSATICTGSADAFEAGVASCVPFPEPEYDPVDRVAVWKPDVFFEPNVRYTLRVHAPTDESDPYGVRAFDGAPLEQDFTLSFWTAASPPPSCATDADCEAPARCSSSVNGHCTREPKREIDYCYVAERACVPPADLCHAPKPNPFFALTTDGPASRLSACGEGTTRCHASSDDDSSAFPAGVENPPFGGALVLENGRVRDSIGKVALETVVAPDPKRALESNVPFGVNMPYVDPGHPANSYLLWKLVLKMAPDDGPIVTPQFGVVNGKPLGVDGYRCADLPDAALVAPLDDGGCPSDAGFETDAAVVAPAGGEQPGPIEPWIPVGQLQPIAPGEFDRLKKRIRGGGMPYGPSERMYVSAIRTIEAWIAEGAPTPECP